MKILNKTILSAVGALTLIPLASCSDYLDKEPDTELTIEMVYDVREKVEKAFGYIWSGMPDMNKHPYEGWGYESFADDFQYNQTIMTFNNEWATPLRYYGSWTPSTTWCADMWARYPRLIRQANNFIERAHPIPKDALTDKEVALMKAECRFLKAYYWWCLAEIYGPIPYHEGNISSDASGEELFGARIPLDDMVEILDKEFLAVAELLPAKYAENKKYGRATKLMCLIARARMLLFWASPLVNGNPDYAHYKRPQDPKPLLNPTYNHNKMVRAAQACKQVIDLAEANGYALSKVFNSDGSLDPFLSLQSVKLDVNNNEITWPATNSHDIWFCQQGLPVEINGANILGTTLDLVDDFFMENGLRRTDDGSGYVEDGFSTGVHKRADTQWDGGTGVPGEITANHTYNMFTNREPRFYMAVAFTGAWFNQGNRQYDYRRGGKDNDGGWQTNKTGLAVRKWTHKEDNPKLGSFKGPRNSWMSRLATDYLNFCEAWNEAYDTPADRQMVLDKLNLVRERAGVRQYSFSQDDDEYIRIENTQSHLRDLIRQERHVELCFEGIRWFDIRRWKIMDKLPVITGELTGMDWEGSTDDTHFRRTKCKTQVRVFKPEYYWFPVYIDEVDKNPNLLQSPGWQ